MSEIMAKCPQCNGELLGATIKDGNRMKVIINCNDCNYQPDHVDIMSALATRQRIKELSAEQIYRCMHPHGEYIDASYGCMLQVNSILNFIKGEVE